MNFKKFSTRTRSYLENVEKYLVSTYGSVAPEWEATLYLLADNLDLYEECKKSLKANGLFDVNTYKKNPLLSTLKDLQATILKEIQHLGLSPYSRSKIKLIEEDETEDFIDKLIS